MRIYETHAHMCIVCASTDNMSIICAYTHTSIAHNGIRHIAQQRTCVYAHYAHLAVNMHHLRICATAHHLRSCTCAYNMRMHIMPSFMPP